MTLPAPQTKTEKARLLEVIGDNERLARIRKAAEALSQDETAISPYFVRLVLMEAALPPPAVSSIPELLGVLVNWMFTVQPPALSPPEAGDLFVITNEQRRPVRLGFVQKVDTQGQFVLAVDHAQEEARAYRLPASEVDFWLRLICRSCQQQGAQPGRG